MSETIHSSRSGLVATAKAYQGLATANGRRVAGCHMQFAAAPKAGLGQLRARSSYAAASCHPRTVHVSDQAATCTVGGCRVESRARVVSVALLSAAVATRTFCRS